MTDGTTLCPHCATRFRIAEAQLAAHGGMVRCGHCRQAFDARANYLPDQPSPQLDLPIGPTAGEDDTGHDAAQAEAPLVDETQAANEPVANEAEVTDLTEDAPAPAAEEMTDAVAAEVAAPAELAEPEAIAVTEEPVSVPQPEDAAQQEPPETSDSLDFSIPASEPAEHPAAADLPHHADVQPHEAAALTDTTHPVAEPQPVAEPAPFGDPSRLAAEDDILLTGYQPAFDTDAESAAAQPKRRVWPWVLGICILLLVLVAQASYHFRVGLAARAPGLKPALLAYCEVLGCDVPLPRDAEQIGIESSSLDADADHANQVNLDVLLRNRASHTLAFPALSLTLNDIHDKPLANRTFLPADYLSPNEKVANGMAANRELSIQLRMDTGDLRPVGYRLELFYPR